MASRSQGARVSFHAAKGFTRLEREMGERFLVQGSAVGILHTFERWRPELDTVSVATALNRIAKAPDGPEVIGDQRLR